MNEMEIPQPRERVKAAALMLDQLVPGWHRYIKPEQLVMSNCSLCALGQLFGDNVETSIAKVMYPELWAEKWCDDGFTTALWGQQRGNYKTGMLSAICESKGLDFKETYAYACGAFGMSAELRCMWAEEAADRLVKAEEHPRSVGSDRAEGGGADSPRDPISTHK